jgi:anti-sigma factor RsiW
MQDPQDEPRGEAELMHERLCAWILGEVEPEEARDLEAACAASPELRAEHARLSSTIALVGGVYKSQPALSEQAMERVMAAAEGRAAGGTVSGPRPLALVWWQQPALRAAAAVTALIGGVFGLLALENEGAAEADSVQHVAAGTAGTAATAEPAQRSRLALRGERRRQLEVSLAASTHERIAPRPAKKLEEQFVVKEVLGYSALRKSESAAVALPEEEESFAGLTAMGYTGAHDGDDKFAKELARPSFESATRSLRAKTVLADELRLSADDYAADLLERCRRLPQESPREMYFRYWGDNPFEYTAQDPQSTFSIDVDTASYGLARRYLLEGHLPSKAQVRTEEFLNYFKPDLPAPTEGTFGIHTELAPSRFGGADGRWMLRVGVRGKEVSREQRAPLSLTFVIDVSGSMAEGERLELVKHALRLLVAQLDGRDSIALVAFSNEAREVLPMTSADQRAAIEAALQPLSPEGGTNAEAGLKLGYELALTGLEPGSHSRVIFLSDGVANIGQTDQDRIGQDVRRFRERGVYLNTVGVGMNNHNDVFLEQLADKGDGLCDYVGDAVSVQRALVDRFTGAMIPIASDVKIQVQFDPAAVTRYRLLGYENRAIADADFRNDAVDAGEVGAGHQVVALYELELNPSAELDKLADVRLRWKQPKGAGQHPLEVEVSELEQEVRYGGAAPSFEAASPGYRRSVLVAQFAELLRRSTHAQGDSLQDLIAESTKLAPVLADPDFDDFIGLLHRAEPMLVAERLGELRDELGRTVDEYRRLQYNRALLEELQGLEPGSPALNELREANKALEVRIRELALQHLGGKR